MPTCAGDFITITSKGVPVLAVGKKGSPHMLTHLGQMVRFFLFSSPKQMLLLHLKYAIMVIN